MPRFTVAQTLVVKGFFISYTELKYGHKKTEDMQLYFVYNSDKNINSVHVFVDIWRNNHIFKT